jgi:hypothetical protein
MAVAEFEREIIREGVNSGLRAASLSFATSTRGRAREGALRLEPKNHGGDRNGPLV